MTQTSVNSQTTDYGLRREILSRMETLAQSVSTMAPTTTPAATIPLVSALAGNGTWLAYMLATIAVLLVALCVTGVSVWIAWRDVKISARLMLWIEAASVSVIVIVVALLLIRHGWHWDWDQLRLRGMTGSGLRLGLVLALFSFVGFESATTLGSEAHNPLKAIPRAVILSSILAGAFFTICAYAEVLGFHTIGQDLGTSPAPMRVLARVGGVPVLGILIDIGALVSMFAGTLACITAAARVLLRMAHDGLAHSSLRTTHARNQTPSLAVVITGVAAVLPVVVLAYRGSSGLD